MPEVLLLSTGPNGARKSSNDEAQVGKGNIRIDEKSTWSVEKSHRPRIKCRAERKAEI